MTIPADSAAAHPDGRAGLVGQRVVIFGASSGIGHAVGRLTAHAGAQVVMVSRSRDRLLEAARDVPGNPETRAVDALDAAAVEAVMDDIGAFDHLAVTAAADETRLFAKLSELSDQTAQRGMEKFWISLNAARAGARHLRPGGSVTLTSSTAITNPPRDGGASVMNAASGAVAVFARSLAAELAPIRVNAIAPGVVNSGVWEDSQRDSLIKWGRTLPVGHIAEPDEIAAAFRFLMTATYITGVVLPVDGGLSLT